MICIVVILLVSFIIAPLIDLTLNERFRSVAKIIFYLVALLYVLYVLFMHSSRGAF